MSVYCIQLYIRHIWEESQLYVNTNIVIIVTLGLHNVQFYWKQFVSEKHKFKVMLSQSKQFVAALFWHDVMWLCFEHGNIIQQQLIKYSFSIDYMFKTKIKFGTNVYYQIAH